jgi:hypothetical protein
MATMIVKGRVSQQVSGQNQVVEIDTGLGVNDQKTLWELKTFEALWESGHGKIKGTEPWYLVQATLTRKPDKTEYLDSEVLSQLRWTAHGGSGVAGVLVPFESLKRDDFTNSPWVANSKIYVVLLAFVAETQELEYKLTYEEKKVSEVEFLKAQSGFCVC